MAKLTKQSFKALLKECLMEILEEENVIFVKESKGNVSKPNRQKLQQMIREEISEPKSVEQTVDNPFLKESINNLSENLSMLDKSKRSIYESIFEDTARTTYQEMIQNDVNYSGPALKPTAQQLKEDEEVLKEMTMDGDLSRWAAVAFGGNNKKWF